MSYNILHVIKDLVTGNLELAEKDVVRSRSATCGTCEAKSRGICTACGCIIVLKVRVKNSECPMMLW